MQLEGSPVAAREGLATSPMSHRGPTDSPAADAESDAEALEKVLHARAVARVEQRIGRQLRHEREAAEERVALLAGRPPPQVDVI